MSQFVQFDLFQSPYSSHVSQTLLVGGRILAPCFCRGIRRWTSTYPVFRRGYSSVDEYLPHVLERVFVHRTITCPMRWRGYLSKGRNTCPMFWKGYSSKGRNTCPMFWRRYSFVGRILASQTEHEADEYEYSFAFVFVRGVVRLNFSNFGNVS